jgi:hypothetical protein
LPRAAVFTDAHSDGHTNRNCNCHCHRDGNCYTDDYSQANAYAETPRNTQATSYTGPASRRASTRIID